MKKYQPNRIFALQAADIDTAWGPRKKMTRFQLILKLILLLPAIFVLVSPSFKIGRGIAKDPGFPIPDRVESGSVIILPVPPEVPADAVQLEGRPMTHVKESQALLAPTGQKGALDITVLFSGTPEKWTWRKLIPKYEHPTFAMFAKRITVEGSTESGTTESASTAPPAELPPALPPLKNPKVIEREDGEANASCWQQPKFELVDDKMGARRNRWTPRVATLTSTAPGEVVVSGQLVEGDREKEVLVYHGGGLYSVYLGLKETNVRKGDKIKGGDTVGIAFAGNKASPIHAKWGAYLRENEVDLNDFMKASAKLCTLTAKAQ